MKKIFSSALAVMFITLGMSVSAEAHGGSGRRTPGINRREPPHRGRIFRVLSGERTGGRRSARTRAFRDRRQEPRAKSDGVVTARERARLQRERNQSLPTHLPLQAQRKGQKLSRVCSAHSCTSLQK